MFLPLSSGVIDACSGGFHDTVSSGCVGMGLSRSSDHHGSHSGSRGGLSTVTAI